MVNIKQVQAVFRRHKMAVALLIVEVAVACAFLSNGALVLYQKSSNMLQASGMRESGLNIILSHPIKQVARPAAMQQADLAAIQRIPGVRGAASVNGLPLSQDNFSTGVSLHPNSRPQATLSLYYGSPGFIKVLGYQLVAGRVFDINAFHLLGMGEGFSGVRRAPSIILSKALAVHLFGTGEALGQLVYIGVAPDHPLRVTGIVKHLLRPALSADGSDNEMAALLPIQPDSGAGIYVVRTRQPLTGSSLKTLGKQVNAALLAQNPRRLISPLTPYAKVRHAYFGASFRLFVLLLCGTLGLLVVTALGIGGLTAYWLNARRHSLGLMRALGATRGDILVDVQMQNLAVIGIGSVLGIALAYALNSELVKHFAFSKLPWTYPVCGVLVLMAVGMISAYAPVRRAISVAPSIVMRG